MSGKPLKRRRPVRPGPKTLNAEQTVGKVARGLFDFFCAPESELRDTLIGDGEQEETHNPTDHPETLDTEGESL